MGDRVFRPVFGVLGALALLLPVLPLRAADCSSLAGRSVTWIVPYSPGGGFDVESRLLAPHLSQVLGTDVAVQNVSGAGGLVGAKAIRNATPDGRTIGVVNGGGLAAVEVLDEAGAPTFSDFTILGRSGTQEHVWVVRQDSPIRTADELAARGKAGQLVFGVTDLGGASFLSTVLGSSVLGFEPTIVAGYRGSADVRVALLRGEVDAMSGTFESSTDMLATKELHAILQLSEAPIADDPLLEGVTVLGGAEGLAAKEAKAAGGDVAATMAAARLAAEVTGIGRFLMAPSGLPPEIEACLVQAVDQVLADPAARADIHAAHRTLQPLTGAAARALAQETVSHAGGLRPQIERALARIRS
jgi:tripartite-type tricarboxylate transporter receptor subunit TctC